MNIDPWKSILKALEPEFDRLVATMHNGSKVVPDLTQIKNKWTITLQEEWVVDSDFKPITTDNLSEAVNWTIEQLRDWPLVRRTAYDIWEFKRKRDAEKFQVLFNLKWAR